ncbi:hypothetical protein PEBR_35430 [Penicillium brasilianum]|uniref:Uncharacterized protein n=1 Tax=Penicillium brasilianum TaxID=104259 RepID=A0A1S9RDV9_PENBI|nr:hypothetical protein PEBR_35430 [Penicillium brasilianum]
MSYAYLSEGVVSDEEGVEPFLAHLPSDTPIYCYNRQCVLESLFPPWSVEDRFVVLKHFPADILAKKEEQLPGRCDYSPSLQILIITMPSQPHEEAASSFEVMFMTLAREMKVYRRIAAWGSTRVDTPDRNKQADRSWGPARLRSRFPTVALEVGFSETTAKLEKDIAWWINGSNGQVRLGITIDIRRQSHDIEIKSWIPSFDRSRQHAYITAGGRKVVDRQINDPPPPRMNQKIHLRRGKDGSSPSIEGGALTIPFRALLLDDPGEGEGDFVFTADMLLHDFAERIWFAIDNAESIEAKKSHTS